MANNKQARTTFSKPVERTTMTDSVSPASAGVELLQFKIPKNLKREFRQIAVDEDLNLTELFLLMFQEYRDNH